MSEKWKKLGRRNRFLRAKGLTSRSLWVSFTSLSDRRAVTYNVGQGWCVLLATAVCYIIRRHRRSLELHAGTRTERVYSQSENGNPLHLVDIRSGRTWGYYVALPRVTLSDESIIQEPPPAYMPTENYIMARSMEGLRVSTDDLFTPLRTKTTILQVGGEGRIVG